MKRGHNGFTIIELLVVIVVIAILASVSVVAYNGVRVRALETKAKADISTIIKAVDLARTNTGKTLTEITGSNGTAYECTVKADATDLAALPKTDLCWVRYTTAISAIATASGASIQNIVDPWGRPYYFDENEGESGGCNKDSISMFAQPFQSGWYTHPSTPVNNVPLSGNSGCSL